MSPGGTIHLVTADDALVLRTLVEDEPRTAAALGSALADRWPDRDPASLAHGVRSVLLAFAAPDADDHDVRIAAAG